MAQWHPILKFFKQKLYVLDDIWTLISYLTGTCFYCSNWRIHYDSSKTPRIDFSGLKSKKKS